MLKEDLEVLAWVVVDPDAWYANAVKVFGDERAQEMLASKLARWRPMYQSAKDKRPRSERDGEPS